MNKYELMCRTGVALTSTHIVFHARERGNRQRPKQRNEIQEPRTAWHGRAVRLLIAHTQCAQRNYIYFIFIFIFMKQQKTEVHNNTKYDKIKYNSPNCVYS